MNEIEPKTFEQIEEDYKHWQLYIQVKSESTSDGSEIVFDIPRNLTKPGDREIVKLTLIDHVLGKSNKDKLGFMLKQIKDQAFVLYVYAVVAVVMTACCICLWLTRNHPFLLHLHTISAFKEGMGILCFCLFMGISGFIFVWFILNPIDNLRKKILNNQSDDDDFGSDLNEFRRCIKSRDYQNARVLSKKHNLGLLVDKNEIQSHYKTVREKQRGASIS